MNTICKMRDIYKALSVFETAFEEMYAISLNEAMVLCALREAGKEITSTAISERTEMAPSHTSKVICGENAPVTFLFIYRRVRMESLFQPFFYQLDSLLFLFLR